MYQPVLPLGGYAGWSFLKRTQVAQQTAIQADTANKRDEDYFRKKIGQINTAAELVSDRRLLRVALTAYGLEGDINSKAFIRKVLSDGTLTDGALSNRLADKRYRDFSAAFGFGDFSTPRNKLSDFADKTLVLFRRQQFETAVGTQNNTYRLALNTESTLAQIAGRNVSENTKWLTIMGNPPLREVFQTALGLPASFATIDIDQQLGVLKQRAKAAFGSDSVTQFTKPEKVEALVRAFVVRAEVNTTSAPQSAASIALQILGS